MDAWQFNQGAAPRLRDDPEARSAALVSARFLEGPVPVARRSPTLTVASKCVSCEGPWARNS